MLKLRLLSRLDFIAIGALSYLMIASLLVLSSQSSPLDESFDPPFFTPIVRTQFFWFSLGWGFFFLVASYDYRKLKNISSLLYLLALLALLGVLFTRPIQGVSRWYRIPFLNLSFQPSECAKMVVVIHLSYYLSNLHSERERLVTFFKIATLPLLPFLLIAKQPDLGTALVLVPTALVMFYYADIAPSIVRLGGYLLGVGCLFISLIFLNIVPLERVEPALKLFLHDYQIKRLTNDNHHQNAATTAIALGSFSGSGWREGEYSLHGWLPTPLTDSVFPALGEEFGFLGLFSLLLALFLLIRQGIHSATQARDPFGRYLAMGMTIAIASPMIINIAMMCGMIPVTGVPLLLVSYGGSSVLFTMISLGLIQSVHCHR